MRIAGLTSFPVRSRELCDFADGLADHADRMVKRNVTEQGLPVHPHWQDWIDSIPDSP